MPRRTREDKLAIRGDTQKAKREVGARKGASVKLGAGGLEAVSERLWSGLANLDEVHMRYRTEVERRIDAGGDDPSLQLLRELDAEERRYEKAAASQCRAIAEVNKIYLQHDLDTQLDSVKITVDTWRKLQASEATTTVDAGNAVH